MPTVLIVDRAPLRPAAREALEAAGFDVVEVDRCEDAPAAIARLRPALVLVDPFAPEMDGFSFTRALSRDPGLARIPVVMIAASPHAGDRVRALWSGASDLLAKPLDVDDLMEAVHALAGDSIREPSEA